MPVDQAGGGCMKLNYKRTFFIGLAFFSICAFWQMYDNIIPLILKNTFHLGETNIGVLMAMDNVLALFLLPFFGRLSDKINTPLGKRTPFILVGTTVALIAMVFLPIADRNANLIQFYIFLGIVLLAMGFYRSPAVALMPDLTPKPLRSKANAIINLMGTLGAVYTLGIVILLVNDEEVKKNGYTKVFIAVAIIMIIAVVLLLITIREKKLSEQIAKEYPSELVEEEVIETQKGSMSPEVKKSFYFILASVFLWFTAYNAVTTAFSRYSQQVWNLQEGDFADFLIVATVAALISYIPIGHISSKIGRKKTIIGGIVLMGFSFLCGSFFLEYSPLVNLIFATTGIGWASINVNSYPMVVEMCKSADIGKYTGLYYTFSMAAQVFTPILSGALLQYVSYRTLFPYAVFFSLAALCTMLRVKHGDSKPLKKSSVIENFDTPD